MHCTPVADRPSSNSSVLSSRVSEKQPTKIRTQEAYQDNPRPLRSSRPISGSHSSIRPPWENLLGSSEQSSSNSWPESNWGSCGELARTMPLHHPDYPSARRGRLHRALVVSSCGEREKGFGEAHYQVGSRPPRSVARESGATTKTTAGPGAALGLGAHDASASASAAMDDGLP